MLARLTSGLGRKSGEFILIVVGVLTALAVDTWVDRASLARDAEEYRTALIRDLSRDADLLRVRAAQRERAFEYARLALSYFEGASSATDPAEILLAVHSSTTSRPFEPAMATWSDLLSTGSLGLIDDAAFRTEIGAYYADIESRVRNWEPFPSHRVAVRGRVPFEVGRYFQTECSILAGGRDPKPQPCDLSDIDGEMAGRILSELADDETFIRDLRYYLSELEVSMRMFQIVAERAESLLSRLDEA